MQNKTVVKSYMQTQALNVRMNLNVANGSQTLGKLFLPVSFHPQPFTEAKKHHQKNLGS